MKSHRKQSLQVIAAKGVTVLILTLHFAVFSFLTIVSLTKSDEPD